MNVLCQSPSWGVDAANAICNVALLISDIQFFPVVFLSRKSAYLLRLEIKPKSEFLPFLRYTSEGNAIKTALHEREVQK